VVQHHPRMVKALPGVTRCSTVVTRWWRSVGYRRNRIVAGPAVFINFSTAVEWWLQRSDSRCFGHCPVSFWRPFWPICSPTLTITFGKRCSPKLQRHLSPVTSSGVQPHTFVQRAFFRQRPPAQRKPRAGLMSESVRRYPVRIARAAVVKVRTANVAHGARSGVQPCRSFGDR